MAPFIRYKQKHQGVILSTHILRGPSKLLKSSPSKVRGADLTQKKLPERAGLLRIQMTRLVSAHVTRFAALFHILPNLEGDVSIFCWSNNSRRPFCLLGIVLASLHICIMELKSKWKQILNTHLIIFFLSPGGGTIHHSNSLIQISHAVTLGGSVSQTRIFIQFLQNK